MAMAQLRTRLLLELTSGWLHKLSLRGITCKGALEAFAPLLLRKANNGSYIRY